VSRRIAKKLTRQTRVVLSEWPPGEKRSEGQSGANIGRAQLSLACAQGFLGTEEHRTQDLHYTYLKYVRTDKPVRLGKSPKVPRLGPRQKQALLEVARTELLGEHMRRCHDEDRLEQYGLLKSESEGLRVVGVARKEYLPKAAIQVLIHKATRTAYKRMDRARDRARDTIPAHLTYFNDDNYEGRDYVAEAVTFARQAQACVAAADAYRRAAKAYHTARVKAKPTKEQVMALVIAREMGV
jgi:hypothetical protein